MSANKKTDFEYRRKKHMSFVLITAGVLLFIAALIIFAEAQFGLGNIYESVTALIFGDNNETEQTQQVSEPPKIKLYSEQSRAVLPGEISRENLISADAAFDEEGAAAALYDGDITTCSGSANPYVTLDAGELKTLSYIRYYPNSSSQLMTNTCVGTKFLASKDNVNYYELGTVYPDVNGDLNPDWHTLEFSGYGEYRYFRVELSPYASFGEIEWICDNGVVFGGSGETDFKFTAFEAAYDFTGYCVLAVYNRDMVLKSVKTVVNNFTVGGYTPVEFTGNDVAPGDYIRIFVYDSATMKQAVDRVLEYRYTESSSRLHMANIYSDNMMFQADEELIISGKAPYGSLVTAELENTETGEKFRGSAVAADVSEWDISLGVFENGGRYKLTVSAEDENLEFDNITFGDIWIFAGQSNMEFYLVGEEEGEELMNSRAGKAQSSNSDIRLLNMYNIGILGSTGEIDDIPLNDWNGYWAELSPDRASYLSAIAYYFALGLNERYDRNVGIISVAVGDTEINQWYPRGITNGTFTGDSGKLYNNRIYPFTNQKIKGILWYQGEADQYRTNMSAEMYSDAMSGLINLYREQWNDPDLPFYYVQLARYAVKDESEIREGQRLALQKLQSNQNIKMISLLDIIGTYEQGAGCAREDIHPWQKRTVAERFLDCVGSEIYGDTNANTTGPRYSGMEIVDNTIVLSFWHTGSLKVMDKEQYADSVCDENISSSMTDTGVLHEFWISDESGKLYPANAEIVDDKVVVWNDSVANPRNVVYAGGAYPEMPNLTDDSNLPAASFNTANGSEFE